MQCAVCSWRQCGCFPKKVLYAYYRKCIPVCLVQLRFQKWTFYFRLKQTHFAVLVKCFSRMLARWDDLIMCRSTLLFLKTAEVITFAVRVKLNRLHCLPIRMHFTENTACLPAWKSVVFDLTVCLHWSFNASDGAGVREMYTPRVGEKTMFDSPLLSAAAPPTPFLCLSVQP